MVEESLLMVRALAGCQSGGMKIKKRWCGKLEDEVENEKEKEEKEMKK